jgi:hypothetical protein
MRMPPALDQERQVGVRPAEQQHLVPQRVPAREHRQVLVDDGVGERVDDLVAGDAGLHQVDDVGLGEHPTLRGDVVQLLGSYLRSASAGTACRP